MAIRGPRVADSDAAQAYLADMADRPQFWREALGGAVDRLAELPVGDWSPCGDTWQEHVENGLAVAEVYVRGLVACALVVDRAMGREDFYQVRDFAVRGARVEFVAEEPGLGVLLRVLDALTAARLVYAVLDGHRCFGGFAPGHGAELVRLCRAAHQVATDRLAACGQEGGAR